MQVANVFLPEEIIANIMWHLKQPSGPTRRLLYAPHHRGTDLSVWPTADVPSIIDQRHDSHVSRSTLVSCMLASRTFYRLAQPVLYHTVDTDRLRAFIHLCLKRPDLAKDVREFSVPWSNGRYHHETKNRPEDHSLSLEDSIANLERRELLARRAARLFLVGITALAVLLLPRLQKLVIKTTSPVDCPLTPEFFKSCIKVCRKQRPERKLKDTNIHTLVVEASSNINGASGWDEVHYGQK